MPLAPEILKSYAELDLRPGAPLEEVRLAYRRLAKALHPDLNPHAVGALMVRVNQAYKILLDHLADQEPPAPPPPPKKTAPASRAGNAPGGAAGKARPTGPQPYDFQEFRDEEEGEEYWTGSGAPPRNTAFHATPAARAAARQERPSGGRLIGLERQGGLLVYLVEITGQPRSMILPVRCRRLCRRCEGNGWLRGPGQSQRCPDCFGRGSLTISDKVELVIPPGWRPGQRLEVRACQGEERIVAELQAPKPFKSGEDG